MAFYNIGRTMGGGLGAGEGVAGSSYSATDLAKASVAHGIAGGTISKLQGGRFGHGALSAGINKLASPVIQNMSGNKYYQGTASAIVGGSVSSISGGKFANGAVTAAMSYGFGQMGRSNVRRLHAGRSSTTGSLGEEQIRAVWEKMRGYSEVAAVEAEKGVFTLTVDASKVTGYYPDTHTINVNPGTFGLEFETVMHSGFEMSIDHLPDAQWHAAMDSYPKWYPFSAERVLFHEAMHALQGGSGLSYTLNTAAYEMPVIRQTNEFMFRNYGEPFRRNHTSFRPRN